MSDDKDTYYIEPIEDHIAERNFIFRQSDRITNSQKCGKY